MYQTLFSNWIENLIRIGLPADKVSVLEDLLNEKRGKIIFQEVLSKKLEIEYSISLEILKELYIQKKVEINYRFNIPSKNNFIDYRSIHEIPLEFETEEETIDPKEYIVIIFKVINNE